jgi:hypothetical protein
MTRPIRTPEIVNGRRFMVEVIDDATAAMYRGMTPAQKAAFVCALNRGVRETLGRFLCREHPDWTTDAVNREIARIMLIASEDEYIPPPAVMPTVVIES